MTEVDRPRARLGASAGHTAVRCLFLTASGLQCGQRPLRHVLVRRADGEYFTTIACHLHAAESERMEGYVDHHLWSSWRSTCAAPVSDWVESGERPGHCEAPLLDEQDGELAEILQHGTVYPKPTDP